MKNKQHLWPLKPSIVKLNQGSLIFDIVQPSASLIDNRAEKIQKQETKSKQIDI